MEWKTRGNRPRDMRDSAHPTAPILVQPTSLGDSGRNLNIQPQQNGCRVPRISRPGIQETSQNQFCILFVLLYIHSLVLSPFVDVCSRCLQIYMTGSYYRPPALYNNTGPVKDQVDCKVFSTSRRFPTIL